MSLLLDTNVVSELGRRVPDARVLAWFQTVAQQDLFVSVLTVGEMRHGIELLGRRDRRAATAYDRWLTRLLDDFAGRIAPVDVDVAQRWGRLGVPDPVPAIDGLLAATALVHGWTLVTRNTRHVAATGVPTLNPFE